MDNTISKKVQAARELGLIVEQEFKKIDNTFFNIVHIKDETGAIIQSYPIPVEKENILLQLEQEKSILKERIEKIESDIQTINNI